MTDGHEQEITIPAEYVESIMLPAAEHEAGHIIAAHHHNVRVLGIGVPLYRSKWRMVPPEIEKAARK